MVEKFYNIEEQRFWNNTDNWSNDGHEWSLHFGTTEILWNDFIFDTVKQFRNKKILEIAPGFGRMSQFLAVLAEELQVVDLNENCINKTKDKLKHHISKYFVNDGKSLNGIESSYFDLVFSFDSFVHMHSNVIEDYIKEINRVLKPNGFGFIHHSWFDGGTDYSFENKSGRSNMNPEVFKNLVEKNGMEIVSQTTINFPEVVDVISVFKKL